MDIKKIVLTTVAFAAFSSTTLMADDTYYKIKNMFDDSKCLDVVNDGVNNKVHMTTCGNYSGQYWKKTLVYPGEPIALDFKASNMFTGEDMCLRSNGETLVMGDCNTWGSIITPIYNLGTMGHRQWMAAAGEGSDCLTNHAILGLPSDHPLNLNTNIEFGVCGYHSVLSFWRFEAIE